MAKQTTPGGTPNKSLRRLHNENLGSKRKKNQPPAANKRSKTYGQEGNTPAGTANIRQSIGGTERNKGPMTRRNGLRTGSESNAGSKSNRGAARKKEQPGAIQTSNNKKSGGVKKTSFKRNTKKQANSV